MVTSTVAWAGIGFPSTDLDLVGSDVIIGLPDDPSVLEYEVLGEVRNTSIEPPRYPVAKALLTQANILDEVFITID